MRRYSPIPAFTDHELQLFWKDVDRADESACWSWRPHRKTKSYGRFKVQGKHYSPHRVSYFLHYGVDPLALLVCHSCDNPACVNPRHLFLGRDIDNVQDRETKGRGNPLSGNEHPFHNRPELVRRGETCTTAKLTNAQVREIRQRYHSGNISHRQLAFEFSVSHQLIGEVINRKRWKHIE